MTKKEKKEKDEMTDHILKLLKVYDFENGFRLIIELLSNTERKDYYFIVTGLVKIDILERDSNFSRSLEYLNKLTSDNYEFSLEYFKKLVNKSLEKANDKKTEIYLEILEGIKRLDIDIDKKYDLYVYLDSVENALSKSSANKDDERLRVEKKFVENKYEELLHGEGIILLKPVSDARKAKIKEVCKSYVDIDVFDVIDNYGNMRLVLRYKDPLYSKIDFEFLINEAQKYHNENNHKKCIDIYKLLLKSENPDFYIYKALGEELVAIGEYIKALDYFTVAEFLANKKGIDPNCEKIRAIAISKLQEEKSSKFKFQKVVSEVCEKEEITYEELIEGLHYAKIKEDKSTILQITLYDIESFRKLVTIAKTALKFKKNNTPYVPYRMQRRYNNNHSFRDDIDRESKPYPLRELIGMLRATDRRSNKEKAEAFLDFKPFMNVRSSDLSYDGDIDYFGIDNFDEIDSYINNNSLNVETAAINLGLSKEQLNIIRLIYAREYYMQGYLKQGDLFVKAVEQDKHKNEYIIEIMEKIKIGKKFYQNRQSDENVRVLSLTLKPRK